MSLPMRERGLKQSYNYRIRRDNPVAPHAGAWIETWMVLILQGIIRVAPHAGAWIETKLLSEVGDIASVAPHAGAWIETIKRSLWIRT